MNDLLKNKVKHADQLRMIGTRAIVGRAPVSCESFLREFTQSFIQGLNASE